MDTFQAELQEARSNNDVPKLTELSAEMKAKDGLLAETWTLCIEAWLAVLRSDFLEALEYVQRARDQFSDLGETTHQYGAEGDLGSVYMYLGQIDQALECYKRCYEYFETTSNRRGLGPVSHNIASCYAQLKNYEEALIWIDKAAEIYKELDLKIPHDRTIHNRGNINKDTGKLNEALKCFEKSSQSEDPYVAQLSLAGILEIHVKKGNWEELAKILGQLDAIENINPLTKILASLGKARLSREQGELEESLRILKDALETASSNQYKAQLLAVHDEISELAKAQKDFDLFLEHQEAANRLKEEISGAEVQKRVAALEKEAELAKIQQQRQKEQAVLYATLPKHAADRVIRGEKVLDHFEEASPLFLDLSGFTELSAIMGASATVELMDRIFELCDEICQTHQLTKVKTIGDCYFAVSGIPDFDSSHALRCAEAALDMLARIEAGDFSINDIGVEVEARIGLSSGPVTAGVLGSKRLQYDAWGDAINMAQRMETTGEAGRIQITREFREALGQGASGFEFSERKTHVKGKGELETYWLSRADRAEPAV